MALTKIKTSNLETSIDLTGINDTATSQILTVSDTGIDVTGTVTADGLTVATDGSSEAEVNIVSGATWKFHSNPTSGTNSYGLDIIKGSAGTDVKMSIDSSGNVGIGVAPTFTPGGSRKLLQVTNGSFGGQIALSNDSNESDNPRIFSDANNLGFATATTGGGFFQFYTGGTERMRIDSSGKMILNHDNTGSVNPTLEFISGTGNVNYINFGDTVDNDAGQIAYVHSDNSLRIRVNGHTEDMRIDSSGNVGIGTDDPATVLHLRDHTANDGPMIRLEGHGINAIDNLLGGIEVYNADGSGNGPQNVCNIKAFSRHSTGRGGYLTFGTTLGDGVSEGAEPFERMRIDSSGNVGIGTDDPTNSADYKTLDIRAVAGGQLILGRPNDVDFFIYSSSATSRIGSGASQELAFHTNSSGSSNERMRIDSSGKVGIGTNDPKTTLNLAANNSGQGAILTLENTDTSITTNDVIGQIDFYANDGSTNGTGAKLNIKGIATSTAGTITALTFGTADSSTNTATERMRIDGSGDVTVSTGNLVIGTSGKGIDFSAYGAGANIDSNLLDDYEEGTWTPVTSQGTTNNNVNGCYTKIGRQVTLTFMIDQCTNYTSGDDILITGLPFTVSNTLSSTSHEGHGAISYPTGLTSADIIGCFVRTTGDGIYFSRHSSAYGVKYSDATAAWSIRGTVTYFTTD